MKIKTKPMPRLIAYRLKTTLETTEITSQLNGILTKKVNKKGNKMHKLVGEEYKTKSGVEVIFAQAGNLGVSWDTMIVYASKEGRRLAAALATDDFNDIAINELEVSEYNEVLELLGEKYWSDNDEAEN